MDAGFNAFLAKPVTSGELARVLSELVSGRAAHS